MKVLIWVLLTPCKPEVILHSHEEFQSHQDTAVKKGFSLKFWCFLHIFYWALHFSFLAYSCMIIELFTLRYWNYIIGIFIYCSDRRKDTKSKPMYLEKIWMGFSLIFTYFSLLEVYRGLVSKNGNTSICF